MNLCERIDCEKPLHRRDDESRGNFIKRRFCDKTCAATVANRKRVGISKIRTKNTSSDIVITNQASSMYACKTYEPGSVEFMQLAAKYNR